MEKTVTINGKPTRLKACAMILLIYQSEFKDVLSDLTPDQIDFVIKFIKDFKTTLKTNKEQFE